MFYYDIKTDNPVIARYRDQRPGLYQSLFLDGDGHLGYVGVEENRAHFVRAGLADVCEVFHERTPVLANSVWYRLAQWPGLGGRAAGLLQRLSSGPLRLPWHGLIWAVDGTVGRLLPARYARWVTSVAAKP